MRYQFGATLADYVVQPTDGLWGVAPGAVVTFWDSADGGSQHTDLLDQGGTPVPEITADSNGFIHSFSGPDGVTGMWADAGGDSRAWMAARNAGSGGGGGYTSIQRIVASATAPADVRAAATYVCDGVADQVEIQAALDDARDNGGGEILLTVGDFHLTEPLSIEGTDDVDVEIGIILRGQGARATMLRAASGIASAINLTKVVRVYLSDFGITVGGATHGITSSTTSGEYSGHRSFWNSNFRNIQINGPWDGSHSGWALNLGSPFRSVFENIEIGGVGSGVRMYSEHEDFNPGDCTFERCFVELYGDNGTAYKIESTTGVGVMNQIEFEMCEAIANGEGCTGIELGGTGPVNHTHWRGVNLEQFDTLINVDKGYGNSFRLNYVQLRSGEPDLTAFVFGEDAYNNAILSCGLVYTDEDMVLFDDGNTSLPSQPNSIERLRVYADGSATVTGSANPAGTTIRRHLVGDGPGTITVLRPPAADAPSQVVTLTDASTINTDASRGTHFKVTLAGNRTLAAPTNPTDGQRVVWEIVASGGARTLTLATGAGGFAFGSDITGTSATASGTTDFLGAIYSAAANRWRVVAYAKGY